MLTGRQATPCTQKILTALHPWRMYCFSHPWRKRFLEMCIYGWLSLPLSSWYCLLWKCPSRSTWQVPQPPPCPHPTSWVTGPSLNSRPQTFRGLQCCVMLESTHSHPLSPPVPSSRSAGDFASFFTEKTEAVRKELPQAATWYPPSYQHLCHIESLAPGELCALVQSSPGSIISSLSPQRC